MLPLTPKDSPFFTPRPGPYVIAEIGVNHEGKLDLARRLIDEAVEGGADCVKFQTYKAGTLAAKNSPSYWDLKSEPTTSQFELFKKYDAFEAADYAALAEHARAAGVAFCSTPFDLGAVELLADLVPFYKIASADITNVPLLRACAAKRKPVILSTGAAYMSEVDEAVRILQEQLSREQIVILHCVLEYPCPYEHANLSGIEHIQQAFPGHLVGYSDHTKPDPASAVMLRAWMLGALVIEKHFTHDKTLPGNDHYHAMNRDDLARFRQSARLLVEAEGSGQKTVLPSEELSRKNARRSLVAARDLPAGHVLVAEDLIAKRPAFGLPPAALEWVLGRPLRLPLAADDFLSYDHLMGERR